jgi:16S rRNA (guanine527-N7)-methyltransferase
MKLTKTRDEEFVEALETFSPRYKVDLSSETISYLAAYFQTLSEWNPRLHLVAPCSPREFATRHILESLSAVNFITPDASVIDVGSGGGLPIIPCLIARKDLTATLVEASPKKAVFLHECLRKNDLAARARVVTKRFETLDPPEADFLTCRALEDFTGIFGNMVEWAAKIRTLLLFGGESLRSEIEKRELLYDSLLMPDSERRFLFVVRQGVQNAR